MEGYGNLPSEQIRELLDYLAQEGVAHHSGNKYFWLAEKYPAESVSLRSASTRKVILQVDLPDGNLTIGEVDQASSLWLVHPQAIYMHEAETYLVDALDLEHGIANLHPSSLDYLRNLNKNNGSIDRNDRTDDCQRGSKSFGDIKVTSQVTGFRKVRCTP